MIKLDKYFDECGTIYSIKEVEITFEKENNNNLNIVTLDKIVPNKYDIDIKNEFSNPNLKEINISFENNTTSHDILTALNSNYKITSLNIKFTFNTFNEEKSKQTKNLKLDNLIMHIDNVELTDMGKMEVVLSGHMVV